MKALRKIAILGITASLVASGVMLAGPASADPVAGGYSATGSDTIQDVMNALTNGTAVTGATVRVTAAGVSIGNFDAFGSAKIQTKPAGPFFVRPAGSGNGVKSLSRSVDSNPWNGTVITGQVDIARSSSGPGANANTNGLLAYVPFARDGMAYAYKAANAADAAVLANLTTAQLTSLYTASSVGAATTIGGVVITPRLPQSGSGTRSFFLGAIAVTTLGGAVNDTLNTTPENDGSVLAANEIIPFSTACWVAQKNGAAPSTFTGTTGVGLGSPTGVAPYTPYPTPGSADVAPLTSSTTYFANTTWGRDTYLVVEYARINPADPKYDATLANLVNPTKAGSLASWSVSPTQPGAVKAKFGFQQASTTSITRAYATLPA